MQLSVDQVSNPRAVSDWLEAEASSGVHAVAERICGLVAAHPEAGDWNEFAVNLRAAIEGLSDQDSEFRADGWLLCLGGYALEQFAKTFAPSLLAFRDEALQICGHNALVPRLGGDDAATRAVQAIEYRRHAQWCAEAKFGIAVGRDQDTAGYLLSARVYLLQESWPSGFMSPFSSWWHEDPEEIKQCLGEHASRAWLEISFVPRSFVPLKKKVGYAACIPLFSGPSLGIAVQAALHAATNRQYLNDCVFAGALADNGVWPVAIEAKLRATEAYANNHGKKVLFCCMPAIKLSGTPNVEIKSLKDLRELFNEPGVTTDGFDDYREALRKAVEPDLNSADLLEHAEPWKDQPRIYFADDLAFIGDAVKHALSAAHETYPKRLLIEDLCIPVPFANRVKPGIVSAIRALGPRFHPQGQWDKGDGSAIGDNAMGVVEDTAGATEWAVPVPLRIEYLSSHNLDPASIADSISKTLRDDFRCEELELGQWLRDQLTTLPRKLLLILFGYPSDEIDYTEQKRRLKTLFQHLDGIGEDRPQVLTIASDVHHAAFVHDLWNRHLG